VRELDRGHLAPDAPACRPAPAQRERATPGELCTATDHVTALLDTAGRPTRRSPRAKFDALARTGKALANGTRLELLDLLAQGERSVEELAGTATVLDVRPALEYAAGHLPSAVSIPLDELEDRLAELPADAEVVAYCRGTNNARKIRPTRLTTTRPWLRHRRACGRRRARPCRP
jgi:hypothetical protein